VTRVYLDHASSSPLRPAAFDAMVPFLRDHFADPGRVHSDGRVTRVAIEPAREEGAALVGARPREIVFTSGATEADKQALLSAVANIGTDAAAIIPESMLIEFVETRGAGGAEVRTGHDDRLVIVFSHHGTDTLDNRRGGHAGPDGEPMLGAGLVALLHRFPNVVLWLNGHIHANRITPRAAAQGGHGFWEVTTASMVDWPCQARVVELFDAGSGVLGVACTMLDHAGDGLAGTHRELAGNVPSEGFDSWRAGTPFDRNAILLRQVPFDLA